MANSDTLTARKHLVEEHMRAENAHDITATMATLGRQPKYVLNGMIIEGREAIRAAYEGIGLGVRVCDIVYKKGPRDRLQLN